MRQRKYNIKKFRLYKIYMTIIRFVFVGTVTAIAATKLSIVIDYNRAAKIGIIAAVASLL